MEQQQGGHEVEASGKSSYQQQQQQVLNRQSSTRWSPTSEQIRVLKELYYNNGVRSPSAEQIQRITAKLRQYGKIEGKNVFYWFQNHKARERQKKRFTTATPPTNPKLFYHQDHHIISPQPPINYYNKFDHLLGANNFPSSSSSPGLNYGYGSGAMEKSFRECSIGSGSTEHQHNFTWIGVDPTSTYSSTLVPYTFLEDQKRKYTTSTVGAHHKTLETEEEEEEEMETLPLFPMHQDINLEARTYSHDYNYTHHHFNSAGCHRPAPTSDVIPTPAAASLELTLNSYI